MDKKKALIINASPHPSGSTATVLGTLENRLVHEYEIERVDLGNRAIKPCTGCVRCRPDGTCVLPRDEATDLGEKIAAADLIAVGTPCYWGNIPSTLKAVFDRNVTTFEHFLKRNPDAETPREEGNHPRDRGLSLPRFAARKPGRGHNPRDQDAARERRDQDTRDARVLERVETRRRESGTVYSKDQNTIILP